MKPLELVGGEMGSLHAYSVRLDYPEEVWRIRAELMEYINNWGNVSERKDITGWRAGSRKGHTFGLWQTRCDFEPSENIWFCQFEKGQKYFRLLVKRTERSILKDESYPRIFIEIMHRVMTPFMHLRWGERFPKTVADFIFRGEENCRATHSRTQFGALQRAAWQIHELWQWKNHRCIVCPELQFCSSWIQ